MAHGQSSPAESEQTLSLIACGPCRRRKRKCDRELPHCRRCEQENSDCRYPEPNQRGIPLGFMNALESRLLETENALFHVLQQCRADQWTQNGSVSIPRVLSAAQSSKREYLAQWERFPLDSTDSLRRWAHEKSAGSSPQVTGDQPAPAPILHRFPTDRSHDHGENLTPSSASGQNAHVATLDSFGLDATTSMADPANHRPLQCVDRVQDVLRQRPSLYF